MKVKQLNDDVRVVLMLSSVDVIRNRCDLMTTTQKVFDHLFEKQPMADNRRRSHYQNVVCTDR